jgi:hypothetical protein
MDAFGLPLFCLLTLFGAWFLSRLVKRRQESDQRRYGGSDHVPYNSM